jgi:acetyl esterase
VLGIIHANICPHDSRNGWRNVITLDPQAQAQLDLNVGRANAGTAAWTIRPQRALPQLSSIRDSTIPAPGGPVPVRIYTPEGAEPFPVTVYIHGGAWVGGSIDSVDPTCWFLAAESRSIIVSVGYRLAPQTKFPGATEDCYTAIVWVADNAASLGGDPGRIAIAGASAGGNLAASVTLMARARGGPPLAYQVLVYPVTDQQMNTNSYMEFGVGYMLDRERMLDARTQYLRSEDDRLDSLAAPLLAEDLSGLPPALIITAGYDVLRDEGEAYAKRLREAGVPTTNTRYEGMMHTFFNAGTGFDKTFEAISEASAALRGAFGSV